jgi:hypothetical protein
VSGVAVAGLLSLNLPGSASADPTECQVVSSSGRCLVAAVDPGRPGGPRPDTSTDGPASRRSKGPNHKRPDPLLPEANAEAERLAYILRSRTLGRPVLSPAPVIPGQTRTPSRRADAQAAAAESVRRAVSELDLPAARIQLSSDEQSFVGTPVWLWLSGGQALTGPTSATAAVGDAAVTATARLVSVDWTLGPPGAQVSCTGPGTPWTGQPGPSPDCGYVYEERSLPERTGGTGKWPVIATAHWQVDWQGLSNGVPVDGGQELQLSSTSALAVGELQALVIGEGR